MKQRSSKKMTKFNSKLGQYLVSQSRLTGKSVWKLSQELSELVGRHQSTVYKWIEGKTTPVHFEDITKIREFSNNELTIADLKPKWFEE